MHQEPIAIPRFVALVSKAPIPLEAVKAWFGCVRGAAPTGTMLAIPTTDDRGLPQTVSLVHREASAKHFYLVPLTRDLEDDETGAIVEAFGGLGIDGDFEIEASASHLASPEKPETQVSIDEDRYMELCIGWAKRQHETWMQDRLAQGWRYGTDLSMTEKTNPLLRPWDQLPDAYRKPNLDEPQALLDLLNDQGYALITREELAAMMTLMRQSAAVPTDIAESVETDEELDEDVFAARLKRASMGSDDRRAYDQWNGNSPGVRKAEIERRSEGGAKAPSPAPAASGGARPGFGKRR